MWLLRLVMICQETAESRLNLVKYGSKLCDIRLIHLAMIVLSIFWQEHMFWSCYWGLKLINNIAVRRSSWLQLAGLFSSSFSSTWKYNYKSFLNEIKLSNLSLSKGCSYYSSNQITTSQIRTWRSQIKIWLAWFHKPRTQH